MFRKLWAMLKRNKPDNANSESNEFLPTEMMKEEFIEEIDGDLFSVSSDISLAHCVGSDLAMGAGIAVHFKKLFGRVDELRGQNVKSGGVAVLDDNDKRFIYYLVTKKSSYQKPTYKTLKESLTAMKTHMIEHDMKNVAMPRIGCGLDGLQWEKVYALLAEIFDGTNIRIIVYNFVPK